MSGARLKDPQLRRVLTVGATMLGGFLDISLCAYVMADQTFAASIGWGALGALVGGLLHIGLVRMGTASDSDEVSTDGDLAERLARFEEASSADQSSVDSDPRAVRWGWNALVLGGAFASFLVLAVLVSLKSIATVVVFAAVSSAPVLGVDTAIVLAISVSVQALVGHLVFERIAERRGITI